MQNQFCFPIKLAIMVSALLGPDQSADLLAGPPETGVRVQVTGPAGQWVSLAIGNFTGNETLTRWKSSHQRLQLADGVASVSLKQDCDGYAVDVFSPTTQPIRVQLFRDEELLDDRKSKGVGHKMVKTGVVTALDEITAPDLSLQAEQKKRLIRLLDAFDDRDTKKIVSDGKLANIDWPSLNAFAGFVTEELGMRNVDDCDSWATWKGKKDTTIFAGNISYQQGDVQATLVTLDNKLVDFVFVSPQLPEAWHTGDVAIQQYAARGETIIREMFEGNVEVAQQIFSAHTRNEITVEKLRPVHQTLVDLFGDKVDSIELREHKLTKADSEDDRTLVLHFDLTTDRKKLCDGRVEVFLDHVNGLVPRGHITSFNVKEKGPSIPPDAKETVTTILTGLAAGDTEAFQQQLSDQMLVYFSADKLHDEVNLWQQHFGVIKEPIAWAEWTDVNGKKGIEGPVKFAKGDAKVRVDFGNSNLIGVTVTGEKYAGSTLDCVQNVDAIVDESLEFWRRLFSKQFDEAYEMLPDLFQKQLSRDKFLEMTEFIAKASVKVADVQIRSARFSTKPDRASPVMIETICLVKLNDHQFRVARCEHHVPGPTDFQLFNFTTEFSSEFPVPFEKHADFLHAVASGSADDVIDLFNPAHQEPIDARVLKALLIEVGNQLGELDLSSAQGVAIRVYNGGPNEVTKVSAELPFEIATVPAEWTYVNGFLNSFHFRSKDVEGFAKNINDTSQYRSRGKELFESWLNGKVADAVAMLAPVLQTEETTAHMKQLKQELHEKLGKLESITHESESFDEQGKTLTQQWKLKFAGGEAKAKTFFSFDALHSYLLRFTVSTSDSDNQGEGEKNAAQEQK